ncbi:MAG: hypothetical protein GY702_13430 [Desulfobulbaceae bacterium]|nr:hypothetical protein [Desulfobulbaceae bacterium]
MIYIKEISFSILLADGLVISQICFVVGLERRFAVPHPLNLNNIGHSKFVMNLIRLLPVFFSFLLIAAHFQRAGFSSLAIICLLSPCLLYFTRPWAVRVVQLLLVLSAIEWLRTVVYLVQLRQEAGMPFTRLAIIIGGVALCTLASAFIFRLPSIKKRYSCGTSRE